MSRAYLVPSDLRRILSDAHGENPSRYLLRFARVDRDVVVAFREVGRDVTMTSAVGPRAESATVSPRMADAWIPKLDHAMTGTVVVMSVADASGEFHDARAFVPADEDIPATVEITFDAVDFEAGYEPPGWLAACREVEGVERFLGLLDAGLPEAGSAAVDELSALMDRKVQVRMALTLMARMPDPDEGLTRWQVIADEARQLGMVLSCDAASVRTALAPLASDGDIAALMAEGPDGRADILVRDGLYVLRGPDGLLGTVPWGEAHGLPPGTVVLGPGAQRPAVLRGEEALALVAEGVRRGDDAPGIGLWSRGNLDGVSAVICGIHPDAMRVPARCPRLASPAG